MAGLGTSRLRSARAGALRQAWDEAITGSRGAVGIHLRSLQGPVAARDDTRPHYAASTVKLAVLAALLRSCVAAGAAPGNAVRVHDSFPGAAGGSFDLRREDDQDDSTWDRLGSVVGVLELAERMIVDSGNLATDLVIERVGLAGVQEFIASAGLAGQLVVNRLIGDGGAEAAGITNTVTAAGLAALMAGMADGSLLEAADRATALDLLARQAHRRMIPAGLPDGTWSASKGGWVTGVKHDVALVRPPSAPAYVLAACTTCDLPDSVGEDLVARISAITWEHWISWHE